jgi:hypothetical protein
MRFDCNEIANTMSEVAAYGTAVHNTIGEVYSPDFPDSQGDYMTAEEIRLMAYRFMAKGEPYRIDKEHDKKECGAFVVESFIARENDPDFISGSWVIGVHIPGQRQCHATGSP